MYNLNGHDWASVFDRLIHASTLFASSPPRGLVRSKVLFSPRGKNDFVVHVVPVSQGQRLHTKEGACTFPAFARTNFRLLSAKVLQTTLHASSDANREPEPWDKCGLQASGSTSSLLSRTRMSTEICNHQPKVPRFHLKVKTRPRDRWTN